MNIQLKKCGQQCSKSPTHLKAYILENSASTETNTTPTQTDRLSYLARGSLVRHCLMMSFASSDTCSVGRKQGWQHVRLVLGGERVNTDLRTDMRNDMRTREGTSLQTRNFKINTTVSCTLGLTGKVTSPALAMRPSDHTRSCVLPSPYGRAPNSICVVR